MINHRKEKITEEKTKKEIINSQIETFKKHQELIEKEEHIKQFNNTVNKKIISNKKIVEEYKHNEQTAIEDLRTSETTKETYITELNNTKDEATITELKAKIEQITNTINNQKEVVNNYTTVIKEKTVVINNLENGSTTAELLAEIARLREAYNQSIITSGE